MSDFEQLQAIQLTLAISCAAVKALSSSFSGISGSLFDRSAFAAKKQFMSRKASSDKEVRTDNLAEAGLSEQVRAEHRLCHFLLARLRRRVGGNELGKILHVDESKADVCDRSSLRLSERRSVLTAHAFRPARERC